jgi:hypothetical protein
MVATAVAFEAVAPKNEHIWPITPVLFNMPMLTIDTLETANACKAALANYR